MHLQPLAHGAGLVLADVAEPVAVQPFRKIQIRSVLSHQDSLTVFHATDRPFAVPAQDTFRIDLFPFTADEPIVGFQFVPISREALRVRSRRVAPWQWRWATSSPLGKKSPNAVPCRRSSPAAKARNRIERQSHSLPVPCTSSTLEWQDSGSAPAVG